MVIQRLRLPAENRVGPSGPTTAHAAQLNRMTSRVLEAFRSSSSAAPHGHSVGQVETVSLAGLRLGPGDLAKLESRVAHAMIGEGWVLGGIGPNPSDTKLTDVHVVRDLVLQRRVRVPFFKPQPPLELAGHAFADRLIRREPRASE